MAKGRPSKKQLILDTAQGLFALHGYQGTAIDLVVREAGVSKPTVYNNFPSKQALLQSLISRQIECIAVRQHSLVNSNDSVSDKLYTLFQQIVEHPFELALYKIYYGESYKLDAATLDLFQQIEQITEKNCRIILSTLSQNEIKIAAIIAIYKNVTLINTLSAKNCASKDELNASIQVLGIISDFS